MEKVLINSLMDKCNFKLRQIAFRYTGHWKNGKKEGYGKLEFPNGGKFIGNFK